MEQKRVAAAIIVIMNNNNIEVFAAQKPDGHWEFPGGKIEQNELASKAAVREIKEELDADIEIDEYVTTITMPYKNYELVLHGWLCHMTKNHIVLKEHVDSKWLTIKDLEQTSLNWFDADKKLIEFMLQNYVLQCY